MSGADPADTLGRVPRGGDHRAGLVAGFDEGHEEVVEADVEEALDHHRLGPLGPHDGRARAVLQGHELGDERLQVVGSVLAVDEQPVETRVAQDFRRDAAGQRRPAADELLAVAEILTESVGQRHVRRGHGRISSQRAVGIVCEAGLMRRRSFVPGRARKASPRPASSMSRERECQSRKNRSTSSGAPSCTGPKSRRGCRPS